MATQTIDVPPEVRQFQQIADLESPGAAVWASQKEGQGTRVSKQMTVARAEIAVQLTDLKIRPVQQSTPVQLLCRG
ncbi:hypothetical protein [Deinococcus soli (ex Cha et al. 2016)]|uniref:Uncharacterized protein n=2 Tax=Deinococcus soli (ex Cha et al. 2016) TaxID=1309411 RepID=A0ACC6KHR5_9DEIO|nr:hypothetical protein [Deinococcus soli (ex Cha et al. 2016)]MDR6219210.1 hypothetical protein [Deinococcus soli (ex Cha et al. 2016)]MDR6329459.1 hypothetical protein [Deinococcus soli (ex Cha et al. 2016)]MDR6752119.1 hypothetical protein [Deinococcus soli (ex Cha et al. 2016)]